MALQDGFKVLNLTVWDGGGGFEYRATGSLTMRAPGSHSIGVGSGFEGTWGSNGSGVINSAEISAAGKNYSSGSWNIAADARAAPGEFVSVGIKGTGQGAIILPTIGQDTSMSFSDLNREKGVGLTSEADIHELYEDFSSDLPLIMSP